MKHSVDSLNPIIIELNNLVLRCKESNGYVLQEISECSATTQQISSSTEDVDNSMNRNLESLKHTLDVFESVM